MDFKIKYKNCTYEEFKTLESMKYIKPKAPNLFWRRLALTLSSPALKKVNFKYKSTGMERLGKGEPALFLMNHSCFLDFQIALQVLRDRKVNIITGLGACICKEQIMRNVGCVPTRKFTTDFTLVKDIKYCLNTLKTSVLMYPEADYPYSGRSHTLPSSVAMLVKLLGVPLVMIETFGAFINDPLYCKSKNRKTSVSAEIRYLLSPEEIKQMSVEEIDALIGREFSFDGFRWQQENGIIIDTPDRAEGLHKILYKCPSCHSEGKTEGMGTRLVCRNCKKEWELTERGFMKALSGETEFDHIPDWYDWQRKCVRREIEDGRFGFDAPVNLYAIVNTKALYVLGKGRLSYDIEGIRIMGYNGKLDFYKKSRAMYAIGANMQWPSIGNGICFGDNNVTYFCVPYNSTHLVLKSRFAAEEIYKILKRPNKGAE